MVTPEFVPVPPVNRQALISLAAALLTVISFCIGIAPLPLTDLFCYSASFVLASVALITGLNSLGQMRRSGESGRPLAWLGISVGAGSLLAVGCVAGAIALLWPRFSPWVQSAWTQLPH
jgi:hypothetical protein